MNRKKLRILMIDDSPEDQEMCRYLLTREGDDYLFVEAETGEKGLEQCQAQKPDCVLLDYMLPDIDGLAMLKRLTDEHGQLLVPVVMLTGQGSESVAVQAMKNGAHDYLAKDQLDGICIAHSIRYAIEQNEAEKAVGKLRKRWEKKHKSLDMNELMGGITKALEPQIKEAGATLEIEPLPRWRGDEEKIRKVFAQLLDNAVNPVAG
jgi:PleD family two-component response regulator